MEKQVEVGKVYYFGTSLNEAGHYFWEVCGNTLRYMSLNLFKVLPFNPEEMPKNCKFLAEHEYYQIGEYSILAYLGSPKDRRGGCKSVFFVKELISEEELTERIMENTIAVKIVTEINNRIK